MLKILLLLGRWFLIYTKNKSLSRMIWDVFVIFGVSTWIAFLYLTVNYFPFVQKIVDNYLESQKSSNIELSIVSVINGKLDVLLRQVLVETSSDRAFIYKFHNGKVDLTGTHFLFFSKTHEVTQSGISSELTKRQNIPLSLYQPVLAEFVKNKCFIITSNTRNSVMYSFLQEMGVKSTILCPIYNEKNSIIGFVGIEYVTKYIEIDQIAKLSKILENYSNKIGAIVSIGNK